MLWSNVITTPAVRGLVLLLLLVVVVVVLLLLLGGDEADCDVVERLGAEATGPPQLDLRINNISSTRLGLASGNMHHH